jgi:hypothetical protein
MNTHCNGSQLEFQGLGRRKVQAAFDAGHVSSDGGGLLLREVDERFRIIERLCACFADYRDPDLVEHELLALLRQRIFGIALGYEDLNDHDALKWDPLFALLAGREDVEGRERRRAEDEGKVLASSSTLNRLELTPADAGEQSRYKKVVSHAETIEAFIVDLFLDSFVSAPEELVLDFDATDDPVHGVQEGRFFHGYYGGYCYMPLYVTCGGHVLVSWLRKSDQDASAGSEEVLARLVAQIRERWPNVRIIVRGDSGFARDSIMTWCESHQLYYVIGLAKNPRLKKRIRLQRYEARCAYRETGQAARVFTEFSYRTRNSWSRHRRVIAKAEHLSKGANPRFVVTNLPGNRFPSRELYEDLYCARGDMENRIKEQQLDMFADRTSTNTMRANQLRLWFSTLAYALVSTVRRIGLKGTELAKATCGTIRVKLFKIGALIQVSVRRFAVRLATACPFQNIFRQAWQNIQEYPLKT